MAKYTVVFNSMLMAIFIGNQALGQDITFDPAQPAKKTDQEAYAEGNRPYNQVLLVPYNPDMHLPDPAGDVELSQFSGKDYNKIRSEMRSGLDMSLTEKIRPYYKVLSLMRNRTAETVQDLETIYGSSNYIYEESGYAKRQVSSSITASDKITSAMDKLTKPKQPEKPVTKGELTVDTTSHDLQYMSVKFPDNKIFPFLSSRYNADLIVFITQFELKKNFDQPGGSAYHAYSREVKVHYIIYDRKGKKINGDVAIARLSEKTDDPRKIMDSVFPVLAEMIASALPRPDMSTPEMKLQKENQKKAEEQDIFKNK